MKYSALLFCACLVMSSLLAQQINWQQSSDWKLYKISGDHGLRFRADSLAYFRYVGMNDDTIHLLLMGVEQWPKDKTAMWMGAYYASCLAEGKLHKINISVHGGFFYDEQAKLYFQIAATSRNDFLAWLLATKKKLSSNE